MEFLGGNGIDEYPISIVIEYKITEVLAGDTNYRVVGETFNLYYSINTDKTVIYDVDMEIILKKQRNKPTPAPKNPVAPKEILERCQKAVKSAKPAPAAKKPATKPTAKKPAAKKTETKPVAKKPAVKKAETKPAAKKPAAKKTTGKKTASKPVLKKK